MIEKSQIEKIWYIKNLEIDVVNEICRSQISEFFKISLKDFSKFLKAVIEQDDNFRNIYYKFYILNFPLYDEEEKKWNDIWKKIQKGFCEWLRETYIESVKKSGEWESDDKKKEEISAEEIWREYRKEIRDIFVLSWKHVSPFFWKLDPRNAYDFMNIYYKLYILELPLKDKEEEKWNCIWEKIQKGFCEWLRETYMESVKKSDEWESTLGSKIEGVMWDQYVLSEDVENFFSDKDLSFNPYYIKLNIGEVSLFKSLYYKKNVLKEPLTEEEEIKWNYLKKKSWFKDEQKNEDKDK